MSNAKLYGKALHTLAEEEGIAKELLLDLRGVTLAFKQHPDYVKILDSPMIEREDLMKILNEDFFGRINKYTLNFIKILCEKRMVHSLEECLEEYEVLYNERHNIKIAKVTTAKPLSAALADKLKKRLEEKTGSEITLQERVDEGCIGGIIIEVDGKQADLTIQTELKNLKEALIN